MTNLIQNYKNIISNELCDNIIKTFNNNISHNSTYSIKEKILVNDISSTVLVTRNTNAVFCIMHKNSNIWKNYYNTLLPIITKTTENYISNFLHNHNNITFTNIEISPIFYIHKYIQNKDFFKKHSDHVTILNFGYRSITLIFYLNDVIEGGETQFIDGTIIKAEKSKLLIFPSTWTYVHEGLISKTSHKYIISAGVKFKLKTI